MTGLEKPLCSSFGFRIQSIENQSACPGSLLQSMEDELHGYENFYSSVTCWEIRQEISGWEKKMELGPSAYRHCWISSSH